MSILYTPTWLMYGIHVSKGAVIEAQPERLNAATTARSDVRANSREPKNTGSALGFISGYYIRANLLECTDEHLAGP